MADGKCRGCGAALPVPEDLAVLSLRCEYCGTEQPAPDLDARRAHVAEREEAARSQAERQARVEAEAEARREEKRTERRVRQLGALRGWAFKLLIRVALVGGVLGFLTAKGWVHLGLLAETWDGKTPFRCEGLGRVRLRNPRADIPGTAILTGKYCWVVLERPDVVADVAASAEGWGKLIVEGGRLVGRKYAVALSDAAVLVNRGGTFEGGVKLEGQARFEGDPVWDTRSTFVCGGDVRATLAGVRAALEGRSAIEVHDRCELHLDGAEIRGTGPLLRVRDRGVVYLTGGRLEATGLALEVGNAGRVVNNNAVIIGRVRRQGQGKLEGRGPEPAAATESPRSRRP